MTISTLFQYLTGKREAILRIANTPSAIWLGMLFVMSAAFAREYDAEDLRSDPWYLAVPLVASLVTSFLLYVLVYGLSLVRLPEKRPFWTGYRSFLSLYWMTAPLAWLYAIPVERFLSASGATSANLWLLAIVSIWRVLLITRVVMVLFGASLAAIWTVMLFADTVVLAILMLTPIPVINVMGGVPLSQSEHMIQSTAITVGLFGGLSWFVWLFGFIVSA